MVQRLPKIGATDGIGDVHADVTELSATVVFVRKAQDHFSRSATNFSVTGALIQNTIQFAERFYCFFNGITWHRTNPFPSPYTRRVGMASIITPPDDRTDLWRVHWGDVPYA